MTSFTEAKQKIQGLLDEAKGVLEREPIASMRNQRIATVTLLTNIMKILGEVEVITQTELKKNPDQHGAYVPYASPSNDESPKPVNEPKYHVTPIITSGDSPPQSKTFDEKIAKQFAKEKWVARSRKQPTT